MATAVLRRATRGGPRVSVELIKNRVLFLVLRWEHLVCLAGAIRIALLFFGFWQDSNSRIKYTDIDYVVFTDAARFMHSGSSPFERATYRYSTHPQQSSILCTFHLTLIALDTAPMLAWMLQPNIWLHPAWGKALFVVADLLVGIIIFKVGRLRGLSERDACAFASIWYVPVISCFCLCFCWLRTDSHSTLCAPRLLNPICINVSTRGNAEAVLSLLIVGWVYFLLKRYTVLAAILFGLSVHFKLYPIVYAPTLALYINHRYCAKPHRLWYSKTELLNSSRLIFIAISVTSFAMPTAIFYYKYGWQFLWEAYFYHFARTDHRHNFSVYFYLLYLQPEYKTIVGLAALLPQLVLICIFTMKFHEDLAFCITGASHKTVIKV